MRYTPFLVAFCLFLWSNCAPIILAPDEKYVDSLLTEKQVLDFFTQGEWIEYRYFDSYTGLYSPGSGLSIQYFPNGRFKQTNSNSSNPIITGKWRFIKSVSGTITKAQPDTRYHKFIQGKILHLSDDTVRYPQNKLINIDTLTQSPWSIIIVTTQEYYEQSQTPHGIISAHYRLKSKMM